MVMKTIGWLSVPTTIIGSLMLLMYGLEYYEAVKITLLVVAIICSLYGFYQTFRAISILVFKIDVPQICIDKITHRILLFVFGVVIGIFAPIWLLLAYIASNVIGYYTYAVEEL